MMNDPPGSSSSGPSRPPLSTEASQVRQSNQTLNAFMGGGHRHAWMANPQASPATATPSAAGQSIRTSGVRKRGRPAGPTGRQNDSTQLLGADLVQQGADKGAGASDPNRPNDKHLPSPAPTDEASPVVQTQVENPGQSTSGLAMMSNPVQSGPSTRTNNGQSHVSHLPAATGQAMTQGVQGMNQPSSRADTLPNNPGASSQPRGGSLASHLQNRTETVPTQQYAQGQVPQPQTMHQSISEMNPTAAVPRAGAGQISQHHRVGQPSAQAVSNRAVPAHISSYPPIAPNNAFHATPQELQEVTQQWHEVLRQHVLPFSDARALDGQAEKPRYRILSKACVDHDVFYVALHQLLCLWSLDQTAVHSALGSVLPPHKVDSGFEILQIILRTNDLIAREHLQYLAQFPLPLDQAVQTYPFYFYVMTKNGDFLLSLNTYWHSLLRLSENRGYPFMAWEVMDMLKCASTNLQHMLFTVSRRHLRVPDGPGGEQLSAVFSLDVAAEIEFTRRVMPVEELERNRQGFANSYLALVARYQARRNPGPSNIQRPALSRAPTTQTMQPRASFQAQPGSQPQPGLQEQGFQVQRSADAQSRTYNLPAQVQVQPPVASNMPVARPVLASSQPQPQPVQGSNPYAPPFPGPVPHQHVRYPSPEPGSAVFSGPIQPQMTLPSQTSAPAPSLPQVQRIPSQATMQNTQRHPSSHYTVQHQFNGQNNLPQFAQPPGIPAQAAQVTQGRAEAAQVPGSGPSWPNPHASQPQAYNLPTAPQQHIQGQYPSRPILPQIQRIPQHEVATNPHDSSGVQVGLHLVGLRSPQRVPAEPVDSDEPSAMRFYQFVQGLCGDVVRIEPRMSPYTLSFDLSANLYAKLSRTLTSTPTNSIPHTKFFDGSMRYRLRFCVKPSTTLTVKESDWVITPTYWPDLIVFEVNGRAVQLRRKQYFQKDLPIELTDHLVQGVNTIKICLPALPSNRIPGRTYFVAVEAVETRSHATLRTMIENHYALAEATVQEISRRLGSSTSDEVMIENASFTISITDPFTARMFNVPVRGVDCLHMECFDLETWLQTRKSKPRLAPLVGDAWYQEPTAVDHWKCPICGRDARPNQLLVDEYFVQVRARLLRDGRPGVKQIKVNANGTWIAIEEPDDLLEDSPGPSTQAGGDDRRHSKQGAAAPVIEILDD